MYFSISGQLAQNFVLTCICLLLFFFFTFFFVFLHNMTFVGNMSVTNCRTRSFGLNQRLDIKGIGHKIKLKTSSKRNNSIQSVCVCVSLCVVQYQAKGTSRKNGDL